MISEEYSSAVLTGMKQRGLSPDDIAHIAGIPISKVKLIMREKAALNDRQLERIENATGITAGQFAASTMNGSAKPLKELMNQLASARNGAKVARSIPSTRQRKVRV